MVCAPARPMTRPLRPAMIEASSGSSGMASSTVGLSGCTSSALERVEVLDLDGAALAEQHHEDREPDCGFRRGDREDEEHEYLPVEVAEVAREGDEVEIRREQQQLDTHQQQDQVLAIEEHSRHRDGEQKRRERQLLCQADHGRGSGSIFTTRRRSAARTATCAEMFCCL